MKAEHLRLSRINGIIKCEQNTAMYKVLYQKLIGPGDEPHFLGQSHNCRYCGTCDPSNFGKKKNAHVFPEALGNVSLFSLDECKVCNSKFSLYEDALCKAIGPFLTLGGVKGKSGVRQTGRSNSDLVLKHKRNLGRRHLQVEVRNSDDFSCLINEKPEILTFYIPVGREKFIPRYAYKALLKIALSLLPFEKLHLFQRSLKCLQKNDEIPGEYLLQVGFSHAYIGNAPPTLAGAVLQRNNENDPLPYVVSIFQAGSVCFQIALRSDDKDRLVPSGGKLGIKWISSLAKPEGGYYPIEYSDPIQFDWSELIPRQQPFEAFELKFNARTKRGEFNPIIGGSNQ